MLAQFVQCYWTVRADSRSLQAEHGIIPGGYTDIVFNVGGQVCDSHSGGVFVHKARSCVVGAFDRYQRFRVEGEFEFIGVRFHPGRAPFFTRAPLREVRNRAVPLEKLWEWDMRSEIRRLELRLAQTSRTSQRISLVEAFLLRSIRGWRQPDGMVVRALGLIDESKGQISVGSMASALRVSGRELERKFSLHVGLSPKAFCRLTRFRHALCLLESMHRPSGCDLAYACGYYDQTHLIREFRLFTGQSPFRFQRVQSVGFFLYDRRSNC